MIDSGSDRTAMELLAEGGLALLPWTRHLLATLWEQVRLLLQVIYCTFISGESNHFRVLLLLFFKSRPKVKMWHFYLCIIIILDFSYLSKTATLSFCAWAVVSLRQASTSFLKENTLKKKKSTLP